MEPLLEILGDEQSKVDPTLADAGLPPAVGVQSWQVFRASKDAPELTDGRGWTYHHHVDMACWRGRLYVGWNSCERDEDVWPSRELYSTSTDGADWAPPAEMFPQGISTPLRIYFYRAATDRMLAIAGLRVDHADTDEDVKGGLVVREISATHELGPVFTLQPSPSGFQAAATYTESGDAGFVAACRELLANKPFLEQQDRGRLLRERRMKWHDAAAWPAGSVPGDDAKWVAGKAYSFFTRPDGVMVGFSKMGWVTTSTDGGETWTQPTVPPTLVTGKAKVWAQRAADGRYALVYNPSRRNRFPLAIVSGDDGVHFGGMRIVQGELPRQRYAGMHRSIGPQYVRGISAWADDGSRAGEGALWVVYSISKEDIWVSRVPLPVRVEADTRKVRDRFTDTAAFSKWNTHAPKWGHVAVVDGALSLQSDDPYDYAAATRAFARTSVALIGISITIAGRPSVPIELDVRPAFGSARPVRIQFTPSGEILALGGDGPVGIGNWDDGRKLSLSSRVDCRSGTYYVGIPAAMTGIGSIPFAEAASSIERIVLRTGPFRNIGGVDPVSPGTDRPVPGATVRVHSLTMLVEKAGPDSAAAGEVVAGIARPT